MFPFNITLWAMESTLIQAQHEPISRPLDRPTLTHVVPKHRGVKAELSPGPNTHLTTKPRTRTAAAGEGLHRVESTAAVPSLQQLQLTLTRPGATLFAPLFISGLGAVSTEPRQLQLRTGLVQAGKEAASG